MYDAQSVQTVFELKKTIKKKENDTSVINHLQPAVLDKGTP